MGVGEYRTASPGRAGVPLHARLVISLSISHLQLDLRKVVVTPVNSSCKPARVVSYLLRKSGSYSSYKLT